jgi:glycosyltransferase involved in cell wall biosynthesis
MTDTLAPHITRRVTRGVPAARPVVMILPAHDEEATVADVVRRAPAFLFGHPVEVVVVDDGSTDRTGESAAAAGATVHSLGHNRGLGAAVREGLAWAVERGAAATAFLDADGEYAPEELAALVAPILEGRADYVVGSRFAGLPRAMRPHRWLGNRALTLAMKLLVRRWGVRGLTDGQSGYRALSPGAAADAEILHDFNYAQVLTLDLIAKGFRYAEVPVSYRFRQHGRSFVRLGPYLRRVVPAVWRELRSAATAAPGAPLGTAPVPRWPMAAPVTLVAETSPSAR